MANSVNRKDVARHAQVSETTVSFVISGKWQEHGISRTTYEKVLAAVKKFGYEPNRAARELRGAKTGRVGLVIRSLDRPFYTPLLEAFHQEAVTKGFALLIFIQKDVHSVDMLVKDALSQTDAVFVGGACSEHYTKDLAKNSPKPIVFMNHRHLDGHYTIITNPADKVYVATKHLIEGGYRNLYFASNNNTRIPGFKRALKEAKIPFQNKMLVAHGAYDFCHGEHLGKEVTLEPAGTTGIVAANDAVAIGCMQYLAQGGYCAGRNYGIVGFDNMAAGAYLPVPLTTVYHDYTAEAKHAFEVLGKYAILKSSNATVYMESKIAVRKSSIKK